MLQGENEKGTSHEVGSEGQWRAEGSLGKKHGRGANGVTDRQTDDAWLSRTTPCPEDS